MVLGGREHILQRRPSQKSAGSCKRSDFSLADVSDWLRCRREIARSVPKLRLSEGESGATLYDGFALRWLRQFRYFLDQTRQALNPSTIKSCGSSIPMNTTLLF